MFKSISFMFLLTLVAVLFSPASADACPRCFGAQVDSPITMGIGMAMLGMIGITGGVLGGIVGFFLYIKRRASKLNSGRYVISDQGVLLPLPERLFQQTKVTSEKT